MGVYFVSRSNQQDMESIQSVGPVQVQQSTLKPQVLLQDAGHLHQGCKYTSPTLSTSTTNPAVVDFVVFQQGFN